MVTNTDGTCSLSYDNQTFSVSAKLEQSGEKCYIVTVIDGVKTQASVVQLGNSVHLFTVVSIDTVYIFTQDKTNLK